MQHSVVRKDIRMLDAYPQTIAGAAQSKSIPLTKGLPLVGSLPQLIKNPFGFLKQARETYGDIYNLNLGVSKILMLNSPRQMQHIFVDNVQNYRKGGAMWDAIRAMLGNGLVVSEGGFWLRQRRMMQPGNPRHLARRSTWLRHSTNSR